MPSKEWAKGSTTAWRKTRALVLARDNYLCTLLLEGCTNTATCVHHLDGKQGGDNPTRLVSACFKCNSKIGDPLKQNPIADPPRTIW